MPDDPATVVQTPLGPDTLIFTHLIGRDEISTCFSYTVGFISTDIAVDPLKMLGKVVSIQGEAGDPKRHFSGIVSRFWQARVEDRVAYYECIVNPWLWFLGNTTDCRIFQNKNAVEIVEAIFSKYSIAKFEKRLQGSYPTRDYCVQYDESDLTFVQRLLEDEGILYFFEHEEGEHTLILTDAMKKLKPSPGYETVPFQQGGDGTRRDVEYIIEWIPGRRRHAGRLCPHRLRLQEAGRRFDGAVVATVQPQAKPPASITTSPARIWMSAVATPSRRSGARNSRRRHLRIPRRGHGARPLLRLHLQAGGAIRADDQNAGVSGRQRRVSGCSTRAIAPGSMPKATISRSCWKSRPTTVPIGRRASRRRPIMRGPQTATVVGPSGEEIFTDEYARVKVQFHWDRRGQEGPEQLLLRARVADLGGQRFRLHPDPAHRPGGDRRFHRGRSGPADHHRPHLQRQPDAALRPARQRHAVGLEIAIPRSAAAATTS